MNQFTYNNGRGASNFSPVPQLLGNQRTPQFYNTFFESGENMTHERFVKSREQAKRNKNNRLPQ